MAKLLVGRDNIEQFICHKERKLYVDQTMILSPGGKDYLREHGMTLVYGSRPVTAAKPATTTAATPKATVAPAKNDLQGTILMILKRDYAISDGAQAAEIVQKVLAKLDGQK